MLALPELPQSLTISAAFSGGISRRLSPRLLRIGTQKYVASISWTCPLRSGALRFVRIHTYVAIPVL